MNTLRFAALLAGLLWMPLARAAAGEVKFHLHDPAAQSVSVAGEFNGWKPAPMTADAPGEWTRTEQLQPGSYGYKFLVNGTDWKLDPENPARKTVDGVENSSVTVGDASSGNSGGAAVGGAGARAAAGGAEFSYVGADAQKVAVAGEFNQWSTTANPMTKDASGTWRASIPLAPGRYAYKFFVDGEWRPDPAAAVTAPDGLGGENSVKVVDAGAGATPAAAAAPAPAATPGASPAAGPVKIGDVELKPGEIAQFDAPLSKKAWADAARLPQAPDEPKMESAPNFSTVKAAIVVPPGFDPKRVWPIVLINQTGRASSVEHLSCYAASAAAAGWVAIAADGPTPDVYEPPARRWALDLSVIEYLRGIWPAAKDWPLACAGFSGGAKYTGFLGAIAARQNFRLVGLWMGGCNADTATLGSRAYKPPITRFARTPIFLSSGTHDTTATPQMVKGVLDSMRASGFRKVRLESYEGGHDPSPAHIEEGLKWFAAEAARDAAAPH